MKYQFVILKFDFLKLIVLDGKKKDFCFNYSLVKLRKTYSFLCILTGVCSALKI